MIPTNNSKRIEIELDSHQLSSFQLCPRLYYWSYLRHKEAPLDKLAISKGTAFHTLLQHFYNLKIKKEKFETCILEATKLAEEDLSKLESGTQLLIKRKFIEYAGFYRNEALVPVGIEVGFSKILYEDAHYLFVYQGKIDFVAEIERGRLAWVDHKTQSRKSDLIAERNQFLGYSWALGYNTGMINYIGLQESYKPADAFRRSICSYKQGIIDEWKASTLRTFYQIAALNGAMKNFLKNRTACEGKYSVCEFLRVCGETSLPIIEGIIEREYKEREPWEPWNFVE